ncbi:alpha/beta hydrolase, partial [Nocardioides sp.]|uniref:alpha/beta hydrolase n=1 Tax=Nocardioides sp. TaxID=35761 RepID=UPI003568355B
KPGTFAAANLTGDLGRLVGTPELVRTLFLSEGVSPDLLHRVAAQVGPESYRAFVDMLALKRPKPARARRVPMLVLGAADDWIFPPRDIEATAAAYATSPVMVDDLAHDVMLDTNWERAAEAVEAWLETLPVSDG